MITLADMQKALEVAREKKNEQQIKLRKAASELVQTYRDSLQSKEPSVDTGEFVDGIYHRKPVAAIELSQGCTLRFILTTALENHVVSKFVVSVSIAMREHDKNLSVQIEDETVLVLGEEAEGRFYETAEKIKDAVLKKIKHLG